MRTPSQNTTPRIMALQVSSTTAITSHGGEVPIRSITSIGGRLLSTVIEAIVELSTQVGVGPPYTRQNFNRFTAASWTPIAHPTALPDHKSPSGSAYWFEEDRVIRRSAHWGNAIGTCDWQLTAEAPTRRGVAFCEFNSFAFNLTQKARYTRLTTKLLYLINLATGAIAEAARIGWVQWPEAKKNIDDLELTKSCIIFEPWNTR